MLIPKIFHRVWFGPHKIPDHCQGYWAAWKLLHPDFQFITWTDTLSITNGFKDQELFIPVNKETFDQCQHFSEQSDIARYEILFRHGGIYVDCDFEPLKSLTSLLENVTNFCGQLEWDRLAVGIIGAIPNHPLYNILVGNIANNYKHTDDSHSLGPLFYSAVVNAWKKKDRLNDLTVFERKLFYPYHWDEERPSQFLNSYAVHHWMVSYRDEKFKKETTEIIEEHQKELNRT